MTAARWLLQLGIGDPILAASEYMVLLARMGDCADGTMECMRPSDRIVCLRGIDLFKMAMEGEGGGDCLPCPRYGAW